jgi:hypothetical protein
MLIANKNGRKIRAMTMAAPIDQCRGVVQCALPGCEAYMALVEPGNSVEPLTRQVAEFLEHHECRAPRRLDGRPSARVVGRRKRDA